MDLNKRQLYMVQSIDLKTTWINVGDLDSYTFFSTMYDTYHISNRSEKIRIEIEEGGLCLGLGQHGLIIAVIN